MSDQVDQFGRDKAKSSIVNIQEDKSKKILESLTEIKNQLENKDFKPNINVNQSSTNNENKNINKISDFDQLHKKVELLEKKINDLINQIELKNYKTEKNIDKNFSNENSIFHNFDKENDLDSGKSLLVLDDQDKSKLYIFKFYHFFLLTLFMIVFLILLISFQLKISFFEVIEIFLSEFN